MNYTHRTSHIHIRKQRLPSLTEAIWPIRSFNSVGALGAGFLEPRPTTENKRGTSTLLSNSVPMRYRDRNLPLVASSFSVYVLLSPAPHSALHTFVGHKTTYNTYIQYMNTVLEQTFFLLPEPHNTDPGRQDVYRLSPQGRFTTASPVAGKWLHRCLRASVRRKRDIQHCCLRQRACL